MPAGMTNGEINRLGSRLRETDTVSPEDLALLQQLREAHDDALAEVARILRDELGLEPTTRLKTVNTLVDKVRREHMKLAEVQDIAGARITLAPGETLRDQDAIVASVQARFPGSRVMDRRVKPTFGYRAVHVIVRTMDCRVEIQVRTELQNAWAQMVENLGDSWGRQIRYGSEPEAPDRAGPAGVTRREAWEDLRTLAEVFDEIEHLVVAHADVDERLQRIPAQSPGLARRLVQTAAQEGELQELTSEVERMRGRLDELEQVINRLEARVTDALAADVDES